MLLDFYRGKKVLVTGHTGFKGSWLCKILINAGFYNVGQDDKDWVTTGQLVAIFVMS